MHKGWLKIHRSLLDKPIWTEATPEQKVLLITLLLMANHNEKQWEWKGKLFTVQPGQFITSLPSLVEKCGKNSSIQKVRTALRKFATYEFLTDESTDQNRLITITNWGVYQRNYSTATDVLTDNQQPTNSQLTANKNVKNEKNLKTIPNPETVNAKSSPFYQLATLLHKNIQQNHPEFKKPNLQRWSNDLRRMIENDKRTIDQINHIITWSQQHDFWHTVVLSPVTLSRNWDRMVAQVKSEHAKRKGQVLYHLPKKNVNEFMLDLTKGEA